MVEVHDTLKTQERINSDPRQGGAAAVGGRCISDSSTGYNKCKQFLSFRSDRRTNNKTTRITTKRKKIKKSNKKKKGKKKEFN